MCPFENMSPEPKGLQHSGISVLSVLPGSFHMCFCWLHPETPPFVVQN